MKTKPKLSGLSKNPSKESPTPARWLRFNPEEFEVIKQAAKLEEMTIVAWMREVILESMDETIEYGPFNLKDRKPVRKLLEIEPEDERKQND